MFLVACLFRLPHPLQGCTWSLLHAPTPPLWGHLENSDCGEQDTHSCLDLSAAASPNSLIPLFGYLHQSFQHFLSPVCSGNPSSEWMPFYTQILLFSPGLSLEKPFPLENSKLKNPWLQLLQSSSNSAVLGRRSPSPPASSLCIGTPHPAHSGIESQACELLPCRAAVLHEN